MKDGKGHLLRCLRIASCQRSREALFCRHTAADRVHVRDCYGLLIWVIFTLLFFSSPKTGLTGRREGDGINAEASGGISGSAGTTPERNKKRRSRRLHPWQRNKLADSSGDWVVLLRCHLIWRGLSKRCFSHPAILTCDTPHWSLPPLAETQSSRTAGWSL